MGFIANGIVALFLLSLWYNFSEYREDKRMEKFRRENPDVNIPYLD